MFDIRVIKRNNVTLYNMLWVNVRVTDLDIKKAPKMGLSKNIFYNKPYKYL
jgi:hypothetical protein